LKFIKVVIPPTEPVTDIVYTISVALHINNVDVTPNAGIVYEPAV